MAKCKRFPKKVTQRVLEWDSDTLLHWVICMDFKEADFLMITHILENVPEACDERGQDGDTTFHYLFEYSKRAGLVDLEIDRTMMKNSIQMQLLSRIVKRKRHLCKSSSIASHTNTLLVSLTSFVQKR